MVMDADVPVVESGGKTDFRVRQHSCALYRPTKVDRVLHDGDEVRLGGTVLVAHLTPGHTKGCTTWTMKVTERGKTYNVVIVGSPNVNPGYKLVGNTAYPQIAEDYERMWRVLKSLPCDIFLGAHGSTSASKRSTRACDKAGQTRSSILKATRRSLRKGRRRSTPNSRNKRVGAT